MNPSNATPTTPDNPTAANHDDDAETPDYITSPLWMIAVGMVIFFATAALLTES